jgi:hypothetical protein
MVIKIIGNQRSLPQSIMLLLTVLDVTKLHQASKTGPCLVNLSSEEHQR